MVVAMSHYSEEMKDRTIYINYHLHTNSRRKKIVSFDSVLDTTIKY